VRALAERRAEGWAACVSRPGKRGRGGGGVLGYWATGKEVGRGERMGWVGLGAGFPLFFLVFFLLCLSYFYSFSKSIFLIQTQI